MLQGYISQQIFRPAFPARSGARVAHVWHLRSLRGIRRYYPAALHTDHHVSTLPNFDFDKENDLMMQDIKELLQDAQL